MGPLLKFLSLTFALTWACFLVVVATSHQATPLPAMIASARGVLLLVGTFAPSLVALALVAGHEGRAGVKSLLRRILQWQVAKRWYVLAISYMAAVKLTAALIHRVVTGSWPPFGHEGPLVIMAAIIISTPFQAGEEIGWRGYALPRLADLLGFRVGSVVLGLIWALWHLPLFFLPGADKYGQAFPVWLLSVTALSVALAFLYANTNGSLLLTMIMHSALNQTIGIVPSASANASNPFTFKASLVMWLTTALMWVAAGYFLVRMPKMLVSHADSASQGEATAASSLN